MWAYVSGHEKMLESFSWGPPIFSYAQGTAHQCITRVTGWLTLPAPLHPVLNIITTPFCSLQSFSPSRASFFRSCFYFTRGMHFLCFVQQWTSLGWDLSCHSGRKTQVKASSSSHCFVKVFWASMNLYVDSIEMCSVKYASLHVVMCSLDISW